MKKFLSQQIRIKDELVNCTRLQPIRNQSDFEQKKRTHKICKSLIFPWQRGLDFLHSILDKLTSGLRVMSLIENLKQHKLKQNRLNNSRGFVDMSLLQIQSILPCFWVVCQKNVRNGGCNPPPPPLRYNVRCVPVHAINSKTAFLKGKHSLPSQRHNIFSELKIWVCMFGLVVLSGMSNVLVDHLQQN